MAKSLWDEFKDLFKTKEQREQERRDSLADAMDREKDVVKQLEELDRQYRESLPVEEEEQPNLEELFPSDSGLREHEYVPETDEQIEERAKAELEDKKAADKKKLENKYAPQTPWTPPTTAWTKNTPSKAKTPKTPPSNKASQEAAYSRPC